MGNYRQHMTFASTLGLAYAAGATALGGLHWIYGTVAALLTALGGLLPDLDHPIGVELKGFTGILGVLTAVAVWHRLARGVPDLPFEMHLWAAVLAYIFVRHGMRRTMARLMVHRGIMHSFPTCAVWGAAAYLYYPVDSHLIRLVMATAVVVGFLSHLLLDEMFSVDLSNTRIKRSFGTAMKFWAPSLPATLAMYGLLSYLSYRVVQVWPDETFREILAEPVPAMRVPWDEVKIFHGAIRDRIGQAIPKPPEAPTRVNPDDLPARRPRPDDTRRAGFSTEEENEPPRPRRLFPRRFPGARHGAG